MDEEGYGVVGAFLRYNIVFLHNSDRIAVSNRILLILTKDDGFFLHFIMKIFQTRRKI
jgi:hypothetical protein